MVIRDRQTWKKAVSDSGVVDTLPQAIVKNTMYTTRWAEMGIIAIGKDFIAMDYMENELATSVDSTRLYRY